MEKLYEGCALARENNVDLILAVGGGSVCDYSKAVSISAYCGVDPWERYYIQFQDIDPEVKIIPVGCVLTMVGTGSEMNGGYKVLERNEVLEILKNLTTKGGGIRRATGRSSLMN